MKEIDLPKGWLKTAMDDAAYEILTDEIDRLATKIELEKRRLLGQKNYVQELKETLKTKKAKLKEIKYEKV